jgi:hypothetical protein
MTQGFAGPLLQIRDERLDARTVEFFIQRYEAMVQVRDETDSSVKPRLIGRSGIHEYYYDGSGPIRDLKTERSDGHLIRTRQTILLLCPFLGREGSYRRNDRSRQSAALRLHFTAFRSPCTLFATAATSVDSTSGLSLVDKLGCPGFRQMRGG